ncbi:MAG: hypothetical protein AAGE52_36235 [Myxococcota bacterium]
MTLRTCALATFFVVAVTFPGAAQSESARSDTTRSEPAPQPAPTVAPTPEAIAAALARYAHEPRVDELLEALADLPELDPEVPRRAARRARRGGWLPTLRLSLRRGQARDLSEQFDRDDDRTRVSTDDDLTLEASLTLRLDRAAYGPDEVPLLRESRARDQDRQERARNVIAAYYERRRLQLERDLLGRRDTETLIRIAELEALLDAFTGGAFTRMMRRTR